MATKKTTGFVLKWQRSVLEHLVIERPTNHSSVAAVVPVLVIHSDKYGEKCFPSQRTIADMAGFKDRGTARRAMEYLVAQGFLEHVRNQARGLREYRLWIPVSDVGSSTISNNPDVGSDVGSDVGWTTENEQELIGSEPPNSRTPVTPLEELSKEETRCSNCEVLNGHDSDCAHRPFGESEMDQALANLRAEFSFEIVDEYLGVPA